MPERTIFRSMGIFSLVDTMKAYDTFGNAMTEHAMKVIISN